MSKDQVIIQIHRPNYYELFFFFIAGAISSVPLTLFITQFANAVLGPLSQGVAFLVSIAVFAPFIEEFSKAFPLLYRHGETQRSIFTLALSVGLGFGLFEFITYVVALQVDPVLRIAGLLFHPASTSITAYGIATKRPVTFYMIAVFLHFANNFLAVTNPFGFPASILILTVTIYVSWRLFKQTKEKFIETPLCTVTKA